MQLRELRIRLAEYGPNEGSYVGEVEFMGQNGSMRVSLSPNLSIEVLKVCADSLVEHAKETAGIFSANVIDQIEKTKKIEKKD